MKRYLIPLILILFFLNGLFSADFKVNGVYTAWGQSQHNFWFDNDNKPKYNDNYVVQMLRFKVQGIANENLKFVTRFDIAQGWWGVDNALRSVQRPYGKYGGSSLFDFKDTNFLVHVDQAYVDFSIPKTPLGMRVGRMWYGLGNKIMVDNNYDGIQVDLKNVLGKKVTLGWAKVSEGIDGLSDEVTGDEETGYVDGRDANLLTLNLHNEASSLKYDVFGLYYKDASIKDKNAFVPDKLQFFKTRFSPQVTQLMAFGVAGSYKMGKLKINGEFDYLVGKDDIQNKVTVVDSLNNESVLNVHGTGTSGAKTQMWDINDGNLSGYNLYLKANYAATDKLKVGAIFGMGSGDDDLTGGKGNVNKLRTSGFFYITEVWEDSIMPDEEGITPQGLGAPNVRGYRELENTTIVQLNADAKLLDNLSLFASYSYIRATQPIYEWKKQTIQRWNGFQYETVYSGSVPNMQGKSANDLGQEIDFKFVWKVQKALAIGLRGGYFMPGSAAGYLINGTDEYDSAAWELKSFILYKF